MHRSLLIAATALIATAAQAADPYSTANSISPIPTAAPVNFTGFYVGANVGGGWAQLYSSLTLADGFGDAITLNHTNAASGVIGGGQAGYNWQTGSILLGVEADFGFWGISQTRDIVSASFFGESLALGTKIDNGFAADVTGRVGYVSGPALFYVKGGWAYFDGSAGIHATTTLADLSANNVSKSGIDGWTLGGGIEYLLSPTWSIKGEYQHFDFGSFTLYPVASIRELAVSNNFTADVVKVGLNYHLGGTSYTPLK
jgi:opacity protein-like surface antigen